MALAGYPILSNNHSQIVIWLFQPINWKGTITQDIDIGVALYRTCVCTYIHMYVHTLLYNACSATTFRIHGHCHVYRTCVSSTSTETTNTIYDPSKLCLCLLTMLYNEDNPFVPTCIPFRLPLLTKYYRDVLKSQSALFKTVETLLQEGIIEYSQSAYYSQTGGSFNSTRG